MLYCALRVREVDFLEWILSLFGHIIVKLETNA